MSVVGEIERPMSVVGEIERYMSVVGEIQTTQPTSVGAVTVDSSCCANGVEPPHPQQWGPDLPFFGGMPAMRTRWMAGAAAHKSR